MGALLITGATGFVGRALVRRLADVDSRKIRAAVRGEGAGLDEAVERFFILDLARATNWEEGLQDVECVIHLAGRAHVLRERTREPLEEFRRVNVEGTRELARQASRRGVKRFVFISSVGVNGNQNRLPFTELDKPNPTNPYAVSKWEAEQALAVMAKQTGMDFVIIRPPLVYGPGAPGNFGRLVRLANKQIPLPLGAIHNQRSLVALDNLIDLIITCIDHPAAANQTFLAGDGEDLSTTELLQRLGGALGTPTRLFPVPAWLLEAGARLIGKRNVARQLCGSLQVDISKARELLGWTPPISVDEGLRRAVSDKLESGRQG